MLTAVTGRFGSIDMFGEGGHVPRVRLQRLSILSLGRGAMSPHTYTYSEIETKRLFGLRTACIIDGMI